ncbi:uncharacterized protein LOC129584212 [Paramacrobiotus metropolitanus]|uniref:uncharacterized protein LOC129584212 n=1 Tax=Paramacrobiotus metropolitanus TaxID=2943436 RepID=UPI0024458CF0|nr:uncharacterized protein LOC129584212 [Paramacrobiotus metropolitanus]
MKVYLAAIHNSHREAGLLNPTADDLVVRAVSGFKRLNSPKPDRRLPITLDLMRTLKTRLKAHNDEDEAAMLWSAFCTAFFGFLRISEIISKSQHTYDRASTLLLRDVSISDDAAVITLKRTKTDQNAEGSKITLTATNRSVCPVRAIKTYYRYRAEQGHPMYPFFRYRNGDYLTRGAVNRFLKLLLKDHPDCARLSTHSFRIGAATEAAEQQLPKEEIQRAGRWKSNCVERYIRPRTLTGPDLYRRATCLGAKKPGTGGGCRQ